MKGYTTAKGGKIIILTVKRFEADKWPFNDEGENYTDFYKKYSDHDVICSCLARLTQDEKILFVAEKLGINPSLIILKSKQQHWKEQHANRIK